MDASRSASSRSACGPTTSSHTKLCAIVLSPLRRRPMRSRPRKLAAHAVTGTRSGGIGSDVGRTVGGTSRLRGCARTVDEGLPPPRGQTRPAPQPSPTPSVTPSPRDRTPHPAAWPVTTRQPKRKMSGRAARRYESPRGQETVRAGSGLLGARRPRARLPLRGGRPLPVPGHVHGLDRYDSRGRVRVRRRRGSCAGQVQQGEDEIRAGHSGLGRVTLADIADHGPALGVVLPRLAAAVGRHVEQAQGPVDGLVGWPLLARSAP